MLSMFWLSVLIFPDLVFLLGFWNIYVVGEMSEKLFIAMIRLHKERKRVQSWTKGSEKMKGHD